MGTIYQDLREASVLVTGGGSGIGAALTTGFARQGAKVAFIDIAAGPSEALRDALAEETGRKPLYLNVDLTDVTALRSAVAQAIAANGPIKVLVNNAGFDERHELDAVTEEYWDDNQAINVKQAFFTAQAVVPEMRAAGGGAIVNFTSTSFMLNIGDMPSCTSAKAAIIGLTKGLAGKLGPHNIRVNSIAPGWVMTERQRRLWVTQEALDAHIGRQCIKRPMEVDDMVGPCLFLASDQAAMLTAQTIIVDGGVL